MISTRDDFKKAIEKQAVSLDGTTWLDMAKLDDGRMLCLVLGWQEGYGEGEEKYQKVEGGKVYTLCAKLAVNIDDLQCDYDVDWFMPWNADGDVMDTDMAVDSDGDFDWYEHEAQSLVEGLNNGTLEVR